MRHPPPAPDRPTIRALTVLAVMYTVAAGVNGVLAVTVRIWWTGVLAGLLAAVAVAFWVVVRRCRRETGRVVRLDQRVAGAWKDPGSPVGRRREVDPTRA
jgi:hypothetical protein